ncbi:ATP-dependent DNA helicase [Naasia sp. SYSU D00948]|uniref:ATP-dependent DNA helicase n=1 Tax=Naasia sp. SYSU D00948 TaxID=2817379 RepID=UPI001B310F3B|nr:ATP-dependent DNA helicase [Naasia sp. SYSU D00948]
MGGHAATIEQLEGVELDEAQQAVLGLGDDESGVVVGPPGSGKTTAMVELVAARVASGWRPSEILVLSPARQAASALRDRIALRLGVPTGGPVARTAASVAFEIVREDAARRGDVPPRLLTGAEQDSIIAALLEGHAESGEGPDWPEGLDADVRRLPAFRTELRELMARTTEANLSPADLAGLGRRSGIPEWEAAARFADEYQRVVDSFRSSSYDSGELLAEATALVRSGVATLRPRLVLLDDAQELGSGTAELVAAWVGRGTSVVAFGDPDIASTGFRGGRADLLSRLGETLGLPSLPVLQLTADHRAHPDLRSVTARVTARIGAAGFGTHRARRPEEREDPVEEPRVLRIDASGRPEEIARLASRLRELHVQQDVPWSRMAVVVRSGRLVPSFARGLAVAEVPTRTSLAARPLREEWAARHLVDAVAVAVGALPFDAPTLAGLLLGPLGGLDPVCLRRLRLALRHEELAGGGARSAEELLVEAMSAPGRFSTIDAAPARRAGSLAETLSRVRDAHAAGGSIEELLWLVWERSGLARTWGAQAQGTGVLADEANRHLDSAVALFTAAQRFVERSPGQPATDFLAEVLGADLPEDTLAPRSRQDSVLVCAPTGVLGAEFDVVAVSALQDGVWPNLRLRGTLLHPGKLADALDGIPSEDVDARKLVLDDELRMFALAVSRARTHLVLTCVSNVDEQPSSLLRLLPDIPPERGGERLPLTLRGLVGALRRTLSSDPSSAGASALARLRDEAVPGADPDSWYGVLPPSTQRPLADLEDPEVRVSVSPSKLATVEKSPLGWFVDVMAATPSGFAASIGTVLHAAMEKLSTTPGADLSAQAVMAAVDERWNEFSFESPWLEEYERRRTGRLAEGLADYLAAFERDGHRLLGAESEFEFEVDRALVRGTIDRVELTADGAVVIVDLKTGRRWPAKDELPGHAQLGMYQLAAASGALPAIPADGVGGGAKLLFVADGVGGRLFREAAQEPLTDEALEEFRCRVRAAAETMAGTLFPGVDGLDERDPYARYAYRIHLVPAVSA